MQSTNTLPEGVINGKISQSGRSSSVERSVRDRKAVGSIPAVPTHFFKCKGLSWKSSQRFPGTVRP